MTEEPWYGGLLETCNVDVHDDKQSPSAWSLSTVSLAADH